MDPLLISFSLLRCKSSSTHIFHHTAALLTTTPKMVLRSEPAPSANPDSSTDGTDQERTDPLKRLYSTHSTTTAGDDNDQSNE